VITGMSLRSAFGILDIPFSTWTIVLGHATFCIVIVYNNAVARLRRLSGGILEASADLGANGFQTFRHVLLPNLGSALLAGGMLAFALSFDEVIVTTFTAGQQSTLPIWMLNELVRPRQRPVTNVVAIVVFCDLRAHPCSLLPYPRRIRDRRHRANEGDAMDAFPLDSGLLIGSAFEAGQETPMEPILNPRTGGLILEVPEASTGQVDRAVGGGAQGLSTAGRGPRRPNARRASAHRRPDRGRGRRLCRAGGAELRQADQCRARRRDPGHRRLLPLFCRRGALHAPGRRPANTWRATPA
jgi:hypothetical protein